MPRLSPEEWPRWADNVVRTLRALAYFCAVLTGTGLVFLYDRPSQVDLSTITLTGFMLLIAGAMALVSTLMKRWLLEWVAITGVLFGIFVYLVAIWSRVGEDLSALAGAGAITMLFLFLAIRFLDLTVFYKRYKRLSQVRNRVVNNDVTSK